jgi:apolipoprotein D and lipocalin family protein
MEHRFMKALVLCIFLVLPSVLSIAQEQQKPPLVVVPDVDLQRYMGTWYEIARLPFSYQKQCVSDVTAIYSLLDDGSVKVVNRCRKENGEISEAEGVAKRASENEPKTKLKVRFAPAFLSFLPFVWGDYWIIELAPDYSYVAVGEPEREYLWILSRTPTMDETTFNDILGRLKQNGYDLTGLTRTAQTAH